MTNQVFPILVYDQPVTTRSIRMVIYAQYLYQSYLTSKKQ